MVCVTKNLSSMRGDEEKNPINLFLQLILTLLFFLQLLLHDVSLLEQNLKALSVLAVVLLTGKACACTEVSVQLMSLPQ